MFQITRCRADHHDEPVGLIEMPRFSWAVEGKGLNITQQWYHLQIARDGAFAFLIFDSGPAFSDRSQHVPAEGAALQSATRYYWRVRAGLSGGGETDWSAAHSFVTGLIDPDERVAKFVSAERPRDREHSPGTYVRGTFTLDGEVRAAYAFSTALGVYHLLLNGKKVSPDQMAPGWTSYRHQLMVQGYDITPLLRPGDNCVGAMLGAGWYKGTMGFHRHRNLYGERTALWCQIEVEYRDGRRQRFVSDESFFGAPSPVTFSEIYDGEEYDARREIPGWCEVGPTPGGFAPAQVVPGPMDALVFQPGARVSIQDELPALELFQTPRGETVIDFGQNLTGFVRLEVRGQPGDLVEYTCFEALDAQQNVYTKNLRTAKQTVRYTLSGRGREVYQPLHSFQGFRYIHVKRFPGTPELANFTACAVHTDMRRAGAFRCSSPLLNQLAHNVLWSLKGNFLDVPTDCPQRDERLGWTGDAQIFSDAACLLMDCYPFFQKWLRDLAFDQTADGGVPHVVPDILTGHSSGDRLLKAGTHAAAAWGDAAVIIPWNLHLAYGDVRVLEEQYASMKAWVEFMRARAQGCVWTYKLQFGDWVALDAEEGSYHGTTPDELVCAAYYAHSTGLLAKAALVLGYGADAEGYRALRDEIAADFGRRFFDESGRLTADTQTAHVLALHFGLVPEAYREQTVRGLLRLLKKHDGHLTTGFVGTPYIAHALSDSGCLDEAYELLLKEDFPSWLYQVRMGATTIWEHWDGIREGGSMWSPDMNSFNHYAYGAIYDWMLRAVVGINPDERAPGYKKCVIRPRPGGGLRFAEGSVETGYGTLWVRWAVEDEISMIRLIVRVPHNTRARIELEGAAQIDDDGGLRFREGPRGFAVEVGSGEYMVSFQI